MIMKGVLTILAAFGTLTIAVGQNGYIKFRNNQVLPGFVKVHYATSAHEHQVEIALSKDDPAPKRYHKKDIIEYAIHQDTFRILKEFYPYDVEEIYYEVIDAKVLRSGKVSLLQIHNSYSSLDKGVFETFHDQSPSQIAYFYVLQDSASGFARGVPPKKEKFKQALKEFFSDEVLLAYEKIHGPVHFRDLDKLVAYCNTQATD
jgi:hypothetical protein